MKTIVSMVLASLLFCVSTVGVAADNSRLQKIAVVDVQQVLAKSPQTKKVADKIKKQFKSREAKLQTDQKKLQANQAKLDKDSSVMSDKNRGALRDKIISQRAAFQERVVAFQQDINDAQSKAMQSYLNKIKNNVTKVAKQKGYALVVEMRSVAFVDDGKVDNITSDVIKLTR